VHQDVLDAYGEEFLGIVLNAVLAMWAVESWYGGVRNEAELRSNVAKVCAMMSAHFSEMAKHATGS
jgi:hypothetical protein